MWQVRTRKGSDLTEDTQQSGMQLSTPIQGSQQTD